MWYINEFLKIHLLTQALDVSMDWSRRKKTVNKSENSAVQNRKEMGKNLKLCQDVFLFHPEDLEGFFRTSQTIAANSGINAPQSIKL